MSSESSTVRSSDQLNHSRGSTLSGNRLAKVDSKWYRMRWYLPLLFVFGYIFTFSFLDEFAFEYFYLTLYSFFVCTLLLTKLGSPLLKKLPVWIIFLFFLITYYFKFYLFILVPDLLPDPLGRAGNFSRSSYINTFATMSYTFISFCCISFLLLNFLSKSLRFKMYKESYANRSLSLFLLKVASLLMIITGLIMVLFRVGIVGEPSNLPFRMAGWIVNIRAFLIPSLILLAIFDAENAARKRYFNIGVLLLFIHGLSDVILKSSKSSFLLYFLAFGLLLLITNRITKRRMQLLGIVLVITVAMFPLISMYRTLRLSGMPIADTFIDAAVLSAIESGESGTIFSTVGFFIYRLVGADSLLYIINANLQPLYSLAFNGVLSPTNVMTHYVAGFPEWAMTAVAPGLLGWFYLIGGIKYTIIGIAFFTLLSWIIWCLISNIRIYCLPIAQSLFLSQFIIICSDGGLEGLLMPILIIVGSIAVCELIVRTSRKKRIM